MTDERKWDRERKLSSLKPDFANRVLRVIERLEAAGFDPHIEYAFRSQATQDALHAKGHSKTKTSNHTGDGTEGSGRAADIVDATHRWGVESAGQSQDMAFLFFGALILAATEEGLECGGRWKSWQDFAHLEARRDQ